MQKTLILIDEPIEHDIRVQNIIASYSNPFIFDCNEITPISSPLIVLIIENIFLLFEAILFAPFFWLKFYRQYGYKAKGFSTALARSLRTKKLSEILYLKLKKEYENINIDTVHANDFTCALIGMKFSKEFNCRLIYDAHEIEFHRNRKNSFLRVAFDVSLEKKILKQASKLIVVNKPTVEVYRYIYNFKNKNIEIINNNHFLPHIDHTIKNFSRDINRSAILYVGGGINGRKLEDLYFYSKAENIKVYNFFLNSTPTLKPYNNWILGSKEYLPEILELSIKNHLVLWCCTENICLSYKLALPNKLYQAIAIGIPIIAYKETYLANIVKEYNIGYIYNDNNFKEIINELKNKEKYFTLLQSVSVFQKKLFIDKLEL